MADDDSSANGPGEANAASPARRKIPGNLPYTSSAGVFSRVLEKLPVSEKPSVFTTDFLATVLGASGGSARPIIPIMKATGLLNQSGSPTDLYAQFQTEGGRASAALQALKNGFAEVFKRNQFAHRADEKTLTDIIVAVTGLPRTDKIVKSMLNTFQVFQKYASSARDEGPQGSTTDLRRADVTELEPEEARRSTTGSLGLTYNINVVLPETTNVEVYNAIFRSLRGNLLQ
jgi:hypothetical protein